MVAWGRLPVKIESAVTCPSVCEALNLWARHRSHWVTDHVMAWEPCVGLSPVIQKSYPHSLGVTLGGPLLAAAGLAAASKV